MSDSSDHLAAPGAKVRFEWGVEIPLRDGVKLSAIVARPRETSEPLPVILTLTPYGADQYIEQAVFFSSHEYVFVVADVRGRGNSQGRFDALAQEANDASDVIEWLAAQTWSNGSVAMWGGSYAGYNQWAAARKFPTALATIAPTSAAFPGVDIPFWRNIYNLYEFQWQTLVSGVTTNRNSASLADYWKGVFLTRYLENLPFSSVPELVGNPDMPQAWLEHPCPDDYWDAMVPSRDEFAGIDLPILTITGQYDVDQPGAMEFYKRHMIFGSASARAKHFLVIGPWDHLGTRVPNRTVGGLEFAEASLLDMNALHLEWYDWILKGREQPSFLKKQVAFYLSSAEEWRYAESLPQLGSFTRKLYLGSGLGQAKTAASPGRMVEDSPLSDDQPDHYAYDPLDTRPAKFELSRGVEYLTDNSEADVLNGNGLVYQSNPLNEPLELAGYPEFVVWLSIDVPDTDFEVRLYVVDPEGGTVLLTRDMMRARYRKSLRAMEQITPGKAECYRFNGFYFTARRLDTGSRLHLIIRCPNSIYLEKNYNSGGVVTQESGVEARSAEIKLFHDASFPSYLELPVLNRSAADSRLFNEE